MKRIITLIFMMVVPTLSFAQKSDPKDDIVKAAKSMSYLYCEFTQTKTMSIMNQDMVSSGVLYYASPDKIRWEYTVPSRTVLIINSDKASLVNDGSESSADLQSNRMYREIARFLISSISGDAILDEKTFKTVISEHDGLIIAHMNPVRGDIKRMYSEIIMHFDKKSKMAKEIDLIESNGDKTVIKFHDTKVNEPINSSTFNIN